MDFRVMRSFITHTGQHASILNHPMAADAA
jgi:hypothetical protein